MKEYKVVSTTDRSIVPNKSFMSSWSFEERLQLLEQHINAMAEEGWVVSSSSGLGGYGIPNTIVLVLERDKR